MLKSDASEQRTSSLVTDGNISSITMEVITEIERELLNSPYDMTSLVFLLYEVPDTALQRLLVYQRVSKDIHSTNMNILHEWMLGAKSKSTWRQEFLEALLICQLYGVVRKLGFNVQHLKRQYQPDNIYYNMYVNPTRKKLYKLCEKLDSDNLNTLKSSLRTYKLDTTEYSSCEVVFLKLMSEKIITESKLDDRLSHRKLNFTKLMKLLHKLPGLELFANELYVLENKGKSEYIGQPAASSSPTFNAASDISKALPIQRKPQNYDYEYFASELHELAGLDIEDGSIASDSKSSVRDWYPIQDPDKVGLCLIINQEEFHLCDQSVEDQTLQASLSRRKGSTHDKIALKRTMTALNFEVVTADNLDHIEMMNFIKNSTIEHTKESTSIFMLCILSHGVRDHVFAADCVKVKVEDIQKLLDSEDATHLREKPKVMILQACQVDDVVQMTLVADSPRPTKFFIGKSDFLIYWATSPEYEAFRDEEKGSIFIQFLCSLMQKRNQEQLLDIFTKNNYAVHYYCKKKEKPQMPLIKTSLRKKLYLHRPK